MLLGDLRAAVVAAGNRLTQGGLVPGTSGNVSARSADLVAVTPSGLPLGGLAAEQVTVVDLGGRVIDGTWTPTSELPLHLAVYRATGALAVSHAHAMASTAVSCVCDVLPAVHYNVVQLGGQIVVAPYATFGSEQLAANVVAALGESRTAALMQNHGSVAVGANLDQACERLELLEWLCEVYARAVALGPPRRLSGVELDAVDRTLRSNRYGQRST